VGQSSKKVVKMSLFNQDRFSKILPTDSGIGKVSLLPLKNVLMHHFKT
jgi:hypothetical protein